MVMYSLTDQARGLLAAMLAGSAEKADLARA